MRVLEWVKRRLGWVDCPGCRDLVRLRWIQIPLMFEGEPPILFYYRCPACGWESDTQETIIATKAAREQGYSSAIALLEARMAKGDLDDAQDR